VDGSDPDWADFEAQVNSGAILAVRLRVSVEAATSEGEELTIDCHNDDVWVAAPAHLPELAEEVRQTASKDFGSLSAELRERGVNVSGNTLAGMYVEVTLDDALCEAAVRSATGVAL
jgi:hypothetical protein